MYDMKTRTCKDYGLFSWDNNGNYTGVDPIRELQKDAKNKVLYCSILYH